MVNSFHNTVLKGKTALITGGGGFLGPYHAIALLKAGAKVVLVDIDTMGLGKAEKTIKKHEPKASVLSYEIDISNLGLITELQQNLSKKNINIDILVNNAALNPKMDDLDGNVSGKVEEYDMDLWEMELKVGITGTFICSRVFGSEMAKRRNGAIINISSDLAIRAPDQRVYSPTGTFSDIKSFKPLGYSTVKTALIGMTRYFAEYWGHRGVRVNALLPGGVENNQGEPLIQNVKERTLLGRWAKKDEYQDAIVFLAGQSSDFMTGQSIIMDGGRSVW